MEYRLCHDIADFIYTDNSTAKNGNVNGFILRLVNICGRGLRSRNIDSLNLRPWNGDSLHTEFVEDFIRQFIILLNKTKTGKARIHTKRYKFLFSDVVDDTERCTDQATEKVSHNRKFKAKCLTDDAADMCAKQITA